MNSSSFERSHEQSPSQEHDLAQDAFIAEIEHLKEAELRPGAETADFVLVEKDADLFDPRALTEADRAIWEKVKAGTVTREDLEKYKKEASSLNEAVLFERAQNGMTMHDMIASFDVDKRSRFLFRGFVVNEAANIIREREKGMAKDEAHTT